MTHFVRTFWRTLVWAPVLALMACGEPPGWPKLLAIKITDQFPSYQTAPAANGGLVVKRPAWADKTVDVDDIARFCQRGPKDCNYATDQMLLDLGRP